MRSQKRGLAHAVPLDKYEEMFRAYLVQQSTKYVSTTCGVDVKTAQRYINHGHPARGLPPLKQRYNDAKQALLAVGHIEAVTGLRARLSQIQAMLDPITRTLIDPMTKTYYREQEAHVNPSNFVMLMHEEQKLFGLIKEQEREQNEDESREINLTDPRAQMYLVQKMKQLQQQTVRQTVYNIIRTLDPDGKLGLVNRLPPGDRSLFDDAARDIEQAEIAETAEIRESIDV